MVAISFKIWWKWQSTHTYTNTKSPITHPWAPGSETTDRPDVLISYSQQVLSLIFMFNNSRLELLIQEAGSKETPTGARIKDTAPRSPCWWGEGLNPHTTTTRKAKDSVRKAGSSRKKSRQDHHIIFIMPLLYEPGNSTWPFSKNHLEAPWLVSSLEKICPKCLRWDSPLQPTLYPPW